MNRRRGEHHSGSKFVAGRGWVCAECGRRVVYDPNGHTRHRSRLYWLRWKLWDLKIRMQFWKGTG